ncbi:MAG: hypothetical protein ACYDHN_05965 [Solirubrobacteraceae bacterium]
MKFRVTRHTATSPPEYALDRFSARMGRGYEDVSFTRMGSEIRANLDRDDPVAMTQDERTDIGRRAVLGAVAEICERTSELELDWFAVSPAR